MRLWSLHPKYLDTKGLGGCWSEAHLAKRVITDSTKGYGNHPQLTRFKDTNNALGAIGKYLFWLYDESHKRGFKYNENLIPKQSFDGKIEVSKGQIDYEAKFLLDKLRQRDETKACELEFDILAGIVKVHPLFKVTNNKNIEKWEKVKW